MGALLVRSFNPWLRKCWWFLNFLNPFAHRSMYIFVFSSIFILLNSVFSLPSRANCWTIQWCTITSITLFIGFLCFSCLSLVYMWWRGTKPLFLLSNCTLNQLFALYTMEERVGQKARPITLSRCRDQRGMEMKMLTATPITAQPARAILHHGPGCRAWVCTAMNRNGPGQAPTNRLCRVCWVQRPSRGLSWRRQSLVSWKTLSLRLSQRKHRHYFILSRLRWVTFKGHFFSLLWRI